MNCEHGIDTKGRCRKRAKLYVSYKTYFGERMGPHGSEKVFNLRIAAVCPGHVDNWPNKIDSVLIPPPEAV